MRIAKQQYDILASLTCKWPFSFFSYVTQTLKGTIITHQVSTIHNMFHISSNTTEQWCFFFVFFSKNDFKFCCWCCRLSWIHPWFLTLQTESTFYLHWQFPIKIRLFSIFFFFTCLASSEIQAVKYCSILHSKSLFRTYFPLFDLRSCFARLL